MSSIQIKGSDSEDKYSYSMMKEQFFVSDPSDSFALKQRSTGLWTVAAYMWTDTFGGCCESSSCIKLSRGKDAITHRRGVFRDGQSEKRDNPYYYIKGITILEATDTEVLYSVLAKGNYKPSVENYYLHRYIRFYRGTFNP